MNAILGLLLCVVAMCSFQSNASIPMTIVSHHWQEEIYESNHAALRTGSIYDIQTYFEENFGFFHPKFKYLFHDTGLGAADPIYPIYQEGYQQSWFQLIKAGISSHNRHIDHYSVSETPEGCVMKSAYWVRHIDEFPELYQEERAQGYTLVDISFDYYIKKTEDAECGKHVGHFVPLDFDPFKNLKKYARQFTAFEDIPKKLLANFEAKIGLLKLLKQEFSLSKWPRFDSDYTLEKNSLWYYPRGFPEAYGLTTPRPQQGLQNLKKPLQLLMPGSAGLETEWTLSRLLKPEYFQQFLHFINGKPTPDFDPLTEPGNDTLSLAQISKKNFYTSGREIFPITDPEHDIGDPAHFRLVTALVRPYEPENDILFESPEQIPQLRFVFQLRDPQDPSHLYEQLFLHLMFDAVDRLATPEVRHQQYQAFLQDLDALVAIRESTATASEKESAISKFLERYTQRPIQTLSFSSSLTGVWIFGSLSRSYNLQRNLEPVRIIRSGVDYGYYSSPYDTVLLRKEAEKANGPRKKLLQKILQDLLPVEYRDSRRQDVHALNFNRITCAQCHQMSGRDGIHMQLNDHIDRRIKTSYRATEFFFRELDRQLQEGGKR